MNARATPSTVAADEGVALAEGFARRLGALARRLQSDPHGVRWAERAAFAVSRATAQGHVCVSLAALAERYGESFAAARAALLASGVGCDGERRRPICCRSSSTKGNAFISRGTSITSGGSPRRSSGARVMRPVPRVALMHRARLPRCASASRVFSALQRTTISTGNASRRWSRCQDGSPSSAAGRARARRRRSSACSRACSTRIRPCASRSQRPPARPRNACRKR